MKKVQEKIQLFSRAPLLCKAMKTETQLHHSRLPTENLSRLQGMLLPKKVNSAPDTNWFLSMQIQTGFFPAALDSLPVHELICPLPKSVPPSLPELPRNIRARCTELGDTKSVAEAAAPSKPRHSYCQHWQQPVFLFVVHPGWRDQ